MKNMIDKRFHDIMNGLKSAGKIALREIPVDLLTIDTTYQTDERTSSSKRREQIQILAAKWDENKLMPILVAPHIEDGLFYVINGYGRWQASQMQTPQYEYLCAMVLMDAVKLEPEERRRFESELFITQNSEVAVLTPVQKRGGLENLGDEAVLSIKRMQEKYKFTFISDTGKRGVGVVGSYTDLLKYAEEDGEDCLEYIFKACHESGLDRKYNGYASYLLKAFRDMWKEYPESREATLAQIIRIFRPINPIDFKSCAAMNYPLLNQKNACSLTLEDMLVKALSVKKKRRLSRGKLVRLIA